MSVPLSRKFNHESEVRDVIINFGTSYSCRKREITLKDRAITELYHVMSDVKMGSLGGAALGLGISALLGFSASEGQKVRILRAAGIITLFLTITGVFIRVLCGFVERRVNSPFLRG